MFSFYSMNSISLLLWAICFWILVEIEVRGEPRLWLAFGAVAGLGLMNKHTLVLLGLGLAVGLVLTPARRHLRSRWLWMGLGLAVLLLAPNLVWQQMHGWPSLEFYRNADIYKNVPTPPLEILIQQVLFMNPAALPVWLGGLVFFLATRSGRPYRHLGWIYIALLALMLIGQKSRPDRITAAYTILFAGGGVMLEQMARRARGRWLRPALPILLVVFGAALAPIGLPLLPPEAASSYAVRLGMVPQIEAGEGKRTELPQWLADRFGWEKFVDDVEAAVDTLDPGERDRAMILVPSYGHGGAVELFGRGRDLPPVYASQNTYFFWGPPEETVDVAVIAGFSEETVRWLFEEAERVGRHDCEWCMPWRDGMTIWVARGRKLSFAEAWPRFKHFE